MAETFIPDPGMLEKYAHLLLHYCLQIMEGQRIFVSTSFLAEPLLQAIHREATHSWVAVDYDISFKDKAAIYWEAALTRRLLFQD